MDPQTPSFLVAECIKEGEAPWLPVEMGIQIRYEIHRFWAQSDTDAEVVTHIGISYKQ